jgi:hypothetical protein
MSKIMGVTAMVVLMLLPLSASANGWGRNRVASYYYAAPMYWDPCVIYLPPCPPVMVQGTQPIQAPMPREAPLAAPSAAPPSAGPITPEKGKPEVSESRSFYESFAVKPQVSEKVLGERCAVGFWNLAGRDLSVSIEGQAHVIPRGKSLKIQTGRQFVWRMEGHEAQTETVPPDNSGVEIVIRR